MRRVALTFDDGPSAWTEPILDLLAAYGVPATFFVIGSVAAEREHVLQRMASAGHDVGNHTWSHPALARDCDDERVLEELQRTNALVAGILGAPPRLYRAPHYDVDARVEAVASRLGLRHAHSHVAPPDWHEGWNAPLTVTFVLQQLRPSTIVGLHDGVPPADGGRDVERQATVDAVAAILPALEAREFECVPALELLEEERQ